METTDMLVFKHNLQERLINDDWRHEKRFLADNHWWEVGLQQVMCGAANSNGLTQESHHGVRCTSIDVHNCHTTERWCNSVRKCTR